MAEKKKKSGILRFSAIVPLTLFLGVVIVLNILFFDMGMKKAIEFGLSQAVGANVNVGSFKSSFTELTMDINEIQIPDVNNLENNLLVIGHIGAEASWDALLRAKVYIPKVVVEKMRLDEKRKSKATLLPVDKKSKEEVDKIKKKALEVAKEEYKGNFLGDVANAADKGDMGNISLENLESQKQITAAQNKIEEQKAKLDALIKDLPEQNELNQLRSEISNFPFNDLTNLKKAQKTAKNLDKLKKRIDQTLKKYKKVEKEIQTTLKTVKSFDLNVDRLVQQDLENIKKQAKIPSMEPEKLAQMIFGDEFANKIAKAKKYYGMIEEYLPPKKDKDKVAASKTPRANGRNYQFGTPNSYPLFWVKEVKFQAAQSNPFQVKGLISDITSNQRVVGRPTTGDIRFLHREKKISGGRLAFDIDHRTKPKAAAKFLIDSFPIQNKTIINSPDAKLKMKEAKAATHNLLIVKNGLFDIKSDTDFKDINYDNEAKSKEVLDILNGVAKVSPKLNLKTFAKGKIDNLKIDINSNLAEALNKSLQLMFKERIKALENKYRKQIEDQIGPAKKKLEDQISGVKKQADQAMQGVNDQIAKVKGDIKKEEKKAKKNAGKNLLKGFSL